MTIETITEHGDPNPDPERDDSILPAQADAEPAAPADAALQAHATATIARLLQEHPAVAKAIRDTLRARVYLRELAERTEPGREGRGRHRTARVQPGRQARSGRSPDPRLRAGPGHRRRPRHPGCRAAELGRPGVRPQLRRDLARHVHPGRRVRRGDAGLRDHPQPPEAARRTRGGGHRGVPRVAGAPHRVPGHRVQRVAASRRPAVRPADRHLGRPGPVRLRGPGPDPVPQPLPGARRRPPRRPRSPPTPARRSTKPPRSSSVTSAACTTCSSRGRFARPPRRVPTTPTGTPRSSRPSALSSRPRRDRVRFAAPCTR